MLAHKQRVTIPADHEVRFRLPKDFPAGEAEVIVLAERQVAGRLEKPTSATATPLERLISKYPAAGKLGPAILLEDPTLPLDAESWPSGLKP